MKVQCNDQRMFLRAISSVSSCHRDIQNPHNTEGVLYAMIVDAPVFKQLFFIFLYLKLLRRRNIKHNFCGKNLCFFRMNGKLFNFRQRNSSPVVLPMSYSIMAKLNEYMTETSHLGTSHTFELSMNLFLSLFLIVIFDNNFLSRHINVSLIHIRRTFFLPRGVS